jgi:peroxiredoxin
MRLAPRKMSPLGLAIVLGLAWLLAISGKAHAPNEPEARLAPDFTLNQTSTRDTLTLSEFSGQPVLLFFYDGGDMTSLKALPYINEWHRRYAGDGLAVIGIHCPKLEPMRAVPNAAEVLARTKTTFRVAFDMDRSVYAGYGLGNLPAYVVLRPGLEIALATSDPKPYQRVEAVIQKVLAEIKPDIVNPFLVKPMWPTDDPANQILHASPRAVCGYLSGDVAGCDSARFDTMAVYVDPGDRQKGKIYLQGHWKVGSNSIIHENKYGGSGDHLRIIYSGKDVWLLPYFAYDSPQRIYVKQDNVYLDQSLWGKDMHSDDVGQPYIYMRYSVPVHVVSNRTFGSHQLELIPALGDVAFYYLFFDDGVAE